MSTIPLWKKCLSYITDVYIDYRESEYNPELHVVLSKGQYQLTTSDAIYSHGDLYHNFTTLLTSKLDLSKMKGKKVLVLGLGLGSIPIILDNICEGCWQITAVEIDEEICELASIYAYPQISSEIDTITTDASIYVQLCQEQFDMICVDLFIGDQTPEVFRSTDFLHRLDELLTDDGLVIYNTLAFTKEDKKQSKAYFNGTFAQVFSDAQCLYTHKNNMLISHSDWLK